VALRSVKHVLSLIADKLLTGTAIAMFAMLPMAAHAQGTYAFTGTTAVGSAAAVVNVPVTFKSSGVIGSIGVLTTGIAHLDYTDTGAGSCTGSTTNWIPGQTCTVSVRFLPTAPGERRGAIVVVDSHGAPLATEYLYGVGQGALGIMLPGIINTVAGNGSWLYANDGMAATSASIFLPSGVAVDAAGNLFIADSSNNRIRRVDAVTGLISTFAGNGNPGFSGDTGPAINASIDNPSALALDGAGNLYIADSNNSVVRVVNAATGIITSVAGIGGQQGRSGDGAAANLALLNTPEGLAFDTAGNLYISDMGNNVVRMVNTAGVISTFAGNGSAGYGGDGNGAMTAGLNSPWGLATAGNDLYIADLNNNRIRKVSGGIISTVAGTGQGGALGDGQPAPQAQLNNPAGVAVDVGGNVYIADSGNNRVRKVNAITSNISTIAGTGNQILGGDGGPADQAGIYGPYAVALDGLGNLYVADVFHNRIREVESTQSLQKYPAMRVGRVSPPQPQTFENDGNTALTFTSIAGVTNGAVDSASTTCSLTVPLALSTACVVGAEFAPTVTGMTVTGSISLVSNAANTPGTIQLTGEVDTLDPTVATLTSSGNPAAQGSSLTFTSNVTASGAAPTGTVTFKDGSATLGTGTLNSAGTATFTISSLSLGQHSITAVYSGDANSNPATSAVLTEIIKQTTTTAVTTSAANVVNGTSVTFTATVSGGVMPTGSVIFQDGTTAIGNGVLNGSGVATFATTSLTPGPHNITALYEGDGNSLTSTSAAVAQTVKAVTAVALISSSNPSSAGATVQFTATVTATGSNGSTGAITGAITFMDGTTTLGTGTLNSSGVATYSTATLPLGAHNISASYAGGTYYEASTSPVLTQTVQQATTSTMLASSANPSIVNASVTFTATVMGTGTAPTGTVTFKDGSATLGTGTLNATTGKTSFTTSTLAVGSHSIVATYAGDTNNVTSSSAAMAQVVNKATSATTLVATPNPSSQGVYVQFTAVVTSDGTAPTGTVSFMEGTTTLGSATVGTSGVASFSTNALGMGQHTIVAVYQGDGANSNSSSASLQQNVLPVTSVGLTSNHNPGVAGAAVTFTATVTGQGAVPTGTITFRDGSTVIGTSALNAQGIATLTLSTLGVGTHGVTASYGGDAANASSTSLAFAETMQQAASQTVLTATASTITRGSAVTLTATVTGNGGTPGGSVAFTDNAQPLGTGTLNGAGAASLTTSALTVGQHSLVAQYAGDTNDTGSNSTVIVETVSQASPSIQINSSVNPSLAGSGVTFTATLRNGVATPTGTVTWYDGATAIGTSPMSASAATFNANTLSVGQHAITAAYSGDTNNTTTTSGVLNQTVEQATTTTVQSNANQSVAGTTTHFTATVIGGGSVAVTGSVTFKDGASTLGTGAITNGVAVFDTTTLTVGLHAITAVYSGDSNSQTSTSAPWTQSVTAATTMVTLSSSLNPSVAGAAVTLTAIVTGNGSAATGTVIFKDGATVLDTVNLTGGTAVLTTSALLPGQHALVAQYGGDSDNQPAASPVLTQTVQQRTTTTLQSSVNPALTSQAITLTATVSNGGTTAVATGMVSFSDGATVLGTAPLDVNGVATFIAPSLGAGQHALTANYAGDALNIGSSSTSLTETVQLRASTTSLAASGSTVTTGAPLTLFAAVAGAAVTPTGTVTFYAGNTVIGSQTLSTAGVATLSYTPVAGSYSISAKYSGDAVYAASTSSTLGTITVGQALNFSVTPNPSSVTVQSKQFGVINISLQSLAGFADTMAMGCLGLPSGATCTFSTTQVDLAAGGLKTVQVTLDTSDPLTAGGQAKVETKDSSMTLACGLPVGVLFGLLLWMARRNRRAIGGLLMLALTLLTVGLSGCGAMQINGVAPGTYNVQVFATGVRTGITQSATITLTVTQ
jgi:hypothetical protein